MSDNNPLDRPVEGTGHSAPPPPPAAYPSLPPPFPAAPVPQAPGVSYMGERQYQVAPKSPGLALLASFFIPGLGSMMNGEAGKGIGILLGYIVSWFLVIVLVGFIGLFGFWVWGMVDAYQGARKWNAAHGIIS